MVALGSWEGWKFIVLIASALAERWDEPMPSSPLPLQCVLAVRDGDIFHLRLGPWETRLLNPVPSHSQEQGVTELGIARGVHCSVPALLGTGRGS